MATMMMYQHGVHDIGVDTLPELSESKSSKASSLSSTGSNDNGASSDVGNFEEIGLDDDQGHGSVHRVKTASHPYHSYSTSDLTAASLKNLPTPSHRLPYAREASARPGRDIVSVPRSRPAFPSLKNQVNGITVRTANLGLMPEPYAKPTRQRSLGRSPSSASGKQRFRSPSPNMHLDPTNPVLVPKTRRSSWQSTQRRKSAVELEMECDEDDGDDLPEGIVLDNVPLSPRPPQERAKSQPNSKAPSPERERQKPPKSPKDRVRSVGNGTPPVAAAQGCLKSPQWKSDTAIPTLKSTSPKKTVPSPLKLRAKSWTNALAELNPDARALTEKLEEHADELEHRAQRSSTGSIPTARRSSDYDAKSRHRSALAELPPLRRTNIMIDPLPISKEKEAVLSRTRPSWLPPKDPAEERRHLKEYQKMMARSAEADKRREASRRVRSEHKDQAVNGLQHLWEDDILPRWNDAIRERRTRELWWRGVAPRSRGAVWSRAIGNELGLTEASYNAALNRASELEARVAAGNGSAEDVRQAAWFDNIRGDVDARTWRELRIFQTGAPLHQGLVDVLRAYAMYRSDIGYITGCNTIAALLLLNLPTPAAAFTSLANILNRPLPLSFYVSDPGAKTSAYNLLLQTLALKSKPLADHLTSLPDHDPDAYLGDMFLSVFTDHLALDEAARLWDVYVFEGDSILVRAGIALLLQKEMALLGAKSVEEVKAVLETSSRRNSSDAALAVVAGSGDEERWMKGVREAGKA